LVNFSCWIQTGTIIVERALAEIQNRERHAVGRRWSVIGGWRLALSFRWLAHSARAGGFAVTPCRVCGAGEVHKPSTR
jgi:hypothetical protein